MSLIARLGYLQIVNSEELEAKVKSSSSLTVQVSSPRGMIYDATGKALVTNQANQAITFTRGRNMISGGFAENSKYLDTVDRYASG